MEKRGLQQALQAVGVTAGSLVAWADEMRLGLHGHVRRVWGVRGIKVRQAVQITYAWRYLALAVDGLQGQLWWRWVANLKKESVLGAVQGWQSVGLAAVVWDRAPAHRSKLVRAAGMPLVEQPPYAPELNPAERVFEEVRRAVEGLVYESLDAKVEAVERYLSELAAAPHRVRRLAGWEWIQQARRQLPPPFMVSSQ